jgi:hypothetical protein
MRIRSSAQRPRGLREGARAAGRGSRRRCRGADGPAGPRCWEIPRRPPVASALRARRQREDPAASGAVEDVRRHSRHARIARGAGVSARGQLAVASDEDQASASPRLAPTSLLHLWKGSSAAVAIEFHARRSRPAPAAPSRPKRRWRPLGSVRPITLPRTRVRLTDRAAALVSCSTGWWRPGAGEVGSTQGRTGPASGSSAGPCTFRLRWPINVQCGR